jgi:hypothetical protein
LAKADPGMETRTVLAAATNLTNDDPPVVASKGFDLFLRLLEALGY